MVKLTVDYNNEAKVWFVKTSDLSGVHTEGETLDELCGKLPAIVSDLVESNQDQLRSKDTLYCSFCGKSQREVDQLIAWPTVFVCDQCVNLLREIVEKNRSNPDPATRQAREIKLEELKQLRADIARLHEGLARIEERVNNPPFWTTEEG